MAVRLRKIDFPEEMRYKINAYIKRKGLEITFIEGCMAEFDYTNISAIEPHRIKIETAENELILLYYGSYAEDRNKFYLYDLDTPVSWTKLKEITKNLA